VGGANAKAQRSEDDANDKPTQNYKTTLTETLMVRLFMTSQLIACVEAGKAEAA
jgi:hypothetical protein